MTCINCNHAWRITDDRNRLLCGLLCHAMMLDGLFKLDVITEGEDGFNDVMVVRRPTKFPVKTAKEREKLGVSEAENDALIRLTVAHYRVIDMEFIEYYEHFLSVELERAGLATFNTVNSTVLRTLDFRLALKREPRRLQQWLGGDNTHALQEDVKSWDDTDKEIFNGLLDVTNTKSFKIIEFAESKLAALQTIIQRIDRELRQRVTGFDERRNSQLLAMQYEDFTEGVLSDPEDAMGSWRNRLKVRYEALQRTIENNEDDDARARAEQIMRSALKMAYAVRWYYRQLSPILNVKEIELSVDAIQRSLLNAVESTEDVQAQALEKARVDFTQLIEKNAKRIKDQSAANNNNNAKEKKTTTQKKKNPVVSETGKLKKSSKKAVEPPRKKKTTNTVTNENDMDVETVPHVFDIPEPTTNSSSTTTRNNNNNNNNTSTFTFQPMQLYDDMEVEERTRNINQWMEKENDVNRRAILGVMQQFYLNNVLSDQSAFVDS
jgi:hypothetical protein